jgi:DNA-binding response OmpR family regulator
MTPLERLGLEVAAFNLLGSRGKAALLCALINAGGASIGFADLAKAKAWRWHEYPNADPKTVKVRVCHLREALSDVGLGPVIETHPGHGYSLPEPGRSAVIARLIEEAGR